MKAMLVVMLAMLAMFFVLGHAVVSAAAVTPAPPPKTIWVSGPSGAVTPAAGWQCWGDSIGTYKVPVVVRFNTRPASAVVMVFSGCAAEAATITLAARAAWAEKEYNHPFQQVIWGAALPTATRTATRTRTAVPPTATRTATRTRTAVPPTATRTATRTAVPPPTATAIAMLRADVTHSSGVFKPQLGWTIWCKVYGPYTNVVIKITTAPFYGVSASDCGAQTKAPFNPTSAIKAKLDEETSPTVWTVR